MAKVEGNKQVEVVAVIKLNGARGRDASGFRIAGGGSGNMERLHLATLGLSIATGF